MKKHLKAFLFTCLILIGISIVLAVLSYFIVYYPMGLLKGIGFLVLCVLFYVIYLHVYNNLRK